MSVPRPRPFAVSIRICGSLLAFAAGCATPAPASRPAAASPAPDVAPGLARITLVGTNDLHGWVEARERPQAGGEPVWGGVDMFAAYADALRRHRPGEVLLLDAGDLFQGTLVANLTEGSVVIKAYNLLGYDAVAVGNHEFDYGPEGEHSIAVNPADDPLGNLKARMQQARFPFLVGNVFERATGRAVQWPNARRTLLKEVNGVKVGVIGLSTPTTPTVTLGKNVESLMFPELAPTTVELAAQLRSEGAQIVVVLLHAGTGCSCLSDAAPKPPPAFDPMDLSTCNPKGELFRLIDALPEGTVDAAIAGHTHEYLAHFIRGVPSIQSSAYGVAFGVVELYWDRAAGRLARERTKIWKPVPVCRKVFASTGECQKEAPGGTVAPTFLGEPMKPVASVAQAVAPDILAVKRLKDEPLGPVLKRRFGRDRKKECELGDFVADIMRSSIPDAKIAITNSGGLRADLDPGPLAYGAVYNALPFDNRVATLKLTGEELTRLLQVGVAYNHGIIQVSGIHLWVVPPDMDSCLPDGGRLVRARFEDGTSIDPAATYLVATNDFLASGGDSWDRVLSKVDADRIETRWDLPTLRDIVVGYFKAHKEVDGPPVPGPTRIHYERPDCAQAAAPSAAAPAHP